MELDNSVINLIKAISKVESGGNVNAVGASGEGGSYQFLPSTWNESAKKYGINVPLEQATAGQQNAVAYNIVKEWKDKGYNVTQIASMWNAGSGRPNAFKENWRGVNDKGVAYDTPAYVAKVAQEYVNFKNITPATQSTSGKEYVQDPNNANASIIKPEEVNDSDMYITGSDGYTIKNPNYDPNAKENIGFVQNLVQEVSSNFIRAGVTGYNLVVSVPHIWNAVAAYKSGDQTKFLEEVKLADTSHIEDKVYDAGYLGKVSPTLDPLKQYGDLMTMGSWFLPVPKVGIAGKLATTGTEKMGSIAAAKAVEGLSKESLIMTAKKSMPFFTQGFTYSTGDTLAEGGSVQDAIINGIKTGATTALIGVGINKLSTGLSKSITSKLENEAGKKYDAMIDTLFTANGDPIYTKATEPIWSSIQGGIKGAWKTASKASKTSFTGIPFEDMIFYAINPHLGIGSFLYKFAKTVVTKGPAAKTFITSPALQVSWAEHVLSAVKMSEKIINKIPEINSAGTSVVKRLYKSVVITATNDFFDELNRQMNIEPIKEVVNPNIDPLTGQIPTETQVPTTPVQPITPDVNKGLLPTIPVPTDPINPPKTATFDLN